MLEEFQNKMEKMFLMIDSRLGENTIRTYEHTPKMPSTLLLKPMNPKYFGKTIMGAAEKEKLSEGEVLTQSVLPYDGPRAAITTSKAKVPKNHVASKHVWKPSLTLT